MTPHTLQSVYTPLDLLLLVIVVVVTPILSVLAGRALARPGVRSLVPRYWTIIARSFFTSLVVLLNWYWAGRAFPVLGLDWPIGFRGQIAFALDAAIAAYYIYALFLSPLPPERRDEARKRIAKLRIIPGTRNEFRLFPVVAINGSIAEELLYRGYLIWLFTPFAGLWGAVAISSALFGLGHAYQGLLGVVRTGLVGFVLAAGFALTHSLWWLMLAHVMVNLFGGLFAWRLKRAAA